MWTRVCRLAIARSLFNKSPVCSVVRPIRCFQRGCMSASAESQYISLEDYPSKSENSDEEFQKPTQFQLLNRGRPLLEQNRLSELKILLLRDFERDTGLAKNFDNFLWAFFREYYQRQVARSPKSASLFDKPLDVAETFDYYMKLTEPSPEDALSKLSDRRGKPIKRKFHPSFMFNLLNLAYADYAQEQKQLAKELEHKPEIFESLKQASSDHIYQKILRRVGEYDAMKKQRLHAAILLANDQGIAFFEMLQTVGDMSEKGRFLEYLVVVAAAAKEPRILQPLVDLHNFLPYSYAIYVKIYNELALLYGQKRDLPKMEQLWQRIATSKETSGDLRHYKHPIFRIRHFYRMMNKKPPPEFEQLLRKTEY
uniref:Uncharacterized protein n=1 Tax=Ditylenchus dipsaci TaxID=166011 RepID=A0A915CQZ1_9BILA